MRSSRPPTTSSSRSRAIVPHVLANVVVNQAGATRVEGHEPLANAGGSLRDMTRIAGANPRMWIDVFLDNADAVRAGLAEHRRRIEEVKSPP